MARMLKKFNARIYEYFEYMFYESSNFNMRETHWRNMLEDKSSLVNLQRMMWPHVK